MKSDALFALLRRRGFVWPTAEIYGGAAGLYDYGPLGAALKRRLEEAWTQWFVGLSDDYYLIDPAEILPESVVRASGHLENFTDVEVECAHCHAVFRADSVLEKVRPEGLDGLTPAQVGELLAAHHVNCPSCGTAALSVPKPFNLMFGLDFGPTGRERAYLRPETAQSSYLGFGRMWDVARKALPVGIAVIGKAYRNEIAARQILFRMRAFTQAELQVFFDPSGFPVPMDLVADVNLPVLRVARRAEGHEDPEFVRASDLVAAGDLPAFYVYHLAQMYRFVHHALGYPEGVIRLFEKSGTERAFYNRIQFDVEVALDSLGGYREMGAVHYRGDYDLTRHSAGSGKDLAVTTRDGRRIVPHVLEITFGVDRNLWAVADTGIRQDGERTVWKMPLWLAPVPVAVFPLLWKEHGAYARTVVQGLRAGGVRAMYDDAGSIGKRYARMDEVGTPFCVTVDGESIDPAHANFGTVTLRERDSKRQERIAVPALLERIRTSLLPPLPSP
ncbi:MAG: glycine--tRNA ligase [Thermoplasmata archaeon]